MTSPGASVFTETQWFARRWWWLLGAASVLVVGAVAVALAQAPSWPAALIAGIALPLVLALLWLLRLTVCVDAAGIHYRFPPLLWRWRHWPWTELRAVYPRRYSPLGDFGGWGLRGLPGNLAYNVWGPQGLQLVFASGNRLLLGTQRPDALQVTLATLLAADPALPIELAGPGIPG